MFIKLVHPRKPWFTFNLLFWYLGRKSFRREIPEYSAMVPIRGITDMSPRIPDGYAWAPSSLVGDHTVIIIGNGSKPCTPGIDEWKINRVYVGTFSYVKLGRVSNWHLIPLLHRLFRLMSQHHFAFGAHARNRSLASEIRHKLVKIW